MYVIKRVKILLVVTLSEVGGAQKVVYNIAAGLEPGLFDVTVACAPGGELVRWLRELPQGIRVIEIPELKRNISPLYDLTALYRLYKLIGRERFEVVHCHSSKAGVLGRIAAYLAGVPKIFFTVHGWGINDYQGRLARFFYVWAERLAGVLSTRVVCVSQSDLNKGIDCRLVAGNKLMVIYNGMPFPEDHKRELRRELNLTNEDIIVGTVARLAYQKNPLFLLEAAWGILKSGDQGLTDRKIYFVLVGDGPLKPQCEEFIKDKGLDDRVFLMGARENAPALMREFNIFVLFSRWEGLPLTIIEAMLAGVPVIANDVGGVGELVEHQKSGYLLSKLDLDKAQNAIMDLASDSSKRLSMGDRGRQRAESMFDVNKMVDKYRELYLS